MVFFLVVLDHHFFHLSFHLSKSSSRFLKVFKFPGPFEFFYACHVDFLKMKKFPESYDVTHLNPADSITFIRMCRRGITLEDQRFLFHFSAVCLSRSSDGRSSLKTLLVSLILSSKHLLHPPSNKTALSS